MSIYTNDIEDLRVLRPAQVYALVNLSASRIRQLEAAGQFPKRFALGAHAVGWRAADVRAWLEARIAGGRHGAKGAAPSRQPRTAGKA